MALILARAYAAAIVLGAAGQERAAGYGVLTPLDQRVAELVLHATRCAGNRAPTIIVTRLIGLRPLRVDGAMRRVDGLLERQALARARDAATAATAENVW